MQMRINVMDLLCYISFIVPVLADTLTYHNPNLSKYSTIKILYYTVATYVT